MAIFGKKIATSVSSSIDFKTAEHLITHIDGIIKMDFKQHDAVRTKTAGILNKINKMNERDIKHKRMLALQLISRLIYGTDQHKGAQYAGWFGNAFVDNAIKILESLLSDIQTEMTLLKTAGFMEKSIFKIEQFEGKEDRQINHMFEELNHVTKSRVNKLVKDIETKLGVVIQDDRKAFILAAQVTERINLLAKNLVAQENILVNLLKVLKEMKRKSANKKAITDFSNFNPKFRTFGAALVTLNKQCTQLYAEIAERAKIELPIETNSERILREIDSEVHLLAKKVSGQ